MGRAAAAAPGPADLTVRRLLLLVGFIDALGTGAFAASAVLYFSKVLDLSDHRIAIGMGLAGLIGMALLVPTGALADHLQTKPLLVSLNALLAATVASYLLEPGFGPFIAITAVVLLLQQSLSAVRAGAIGRLGEEGRTAIRARNRAISNLGMALGGGAAAVAVSFQTSTAYDLLLVADVLSYSICCLLSFWLPEFGSPRRWGEREPGARHFQALRDRRYLLSCGLTLIGAVHQTLLFVALPLWVVANADRYLIVVPILFILNTAGVVFLQVHMASRVKTVEDAYGAVKMSAALLAAGCLALTAATVTSEFSGLMLSLVAGILWTASELLQASGAWELSYSLADPERITEYQSLFSVSVAGETALGPLLAVPLVLSVPNGLGWPIIGGVVLVGVSAGAQRLARVDPKDRGRSVPPSTSEVSP